MGITLTHGLFRQIGTLARQLVIALDYSLDFQHLWERECCDAISKGMASREIGLVG